MRKNFNFRTAFPIIFIISTIISLYPTNTNMITNIDFLTKTRLIPTNNNDFLILTYNDTLFNIYSFSEDEISKTANERFAIRSYFFANNELFILCKSERNLAVVKAGDKGFVLDAGFISGVSPKNYCVTAVKHDYIYLVDTKNPKTVLKYVIDDIKYGEYTFDKNINSLFTDKSNEYVYAVTDSGIIDVEHNIFISCPVPTAPYNFYGSYCCDSNGKIFLFDNTSGFRMIMQADYDNLCVINNTVCGTKNNIVYMLSDDGSPNAEYTADSNIKQLSVSGSKMAVLYDDKVEFLYEQNFKNLNNESSNTEISKNHNDPESSVGGPSYIQPPDNITSEPNSSVNSETETSDFYVSSSIYKFSDNIITNIPQGTTIAKLKQNIIFDSGSMVFTDHNNKIKTSGQIGTGWRVDFLVNNKVMFAKYIIIFGDVTGEGNINSRDISSLSNYLLEQSSFSKYQFYASDINNDGTVNSQDLFLIYKATK